jgi:NADPH:quinone reductase-like Zn-dependent oxidoreductase
MRQVVVSKFGGPENLLLEEMPEPHATSGQVRVRVLAAGLNPVDAKIASGGSIAERFGVLPPFGNGNDFAGIVDEVGEGAAWSIGDRVFGGARFFAQSDYIVIGDLTTLNRTPDRLSDKVAGSLDIAGRTAVAGVSALRLSPKDTVLVSAAAGGVGILAVQIARRTGARVVAVASSPHHEELRSLDVIPVAYGMGIEESISKVAPSGVTAVLDCHGAEYVELGLRLGVRASRINSVADRLAAAAIGGLSVGRAMTSTAAIRPVADLIASRAIVLPIAETYPISMVADAYRRLQRGGRLGKIVLTLT